MATGSWAENGVIFRETPSLSHKTPVLLLPDHYEVAWWAEKKRGKNSTFHAYKEAKRSNKSNRFVNLHEFHLKCYRIKLNPMHGCSRRSCRDISVQLMMQTLSHRSWETLPLVLFTQFKSFKIKKLNKKNMYLITNVLGFWHCSVDDNDADIIIIGTSLISTTYVPRYLQRVSMETRKTSRGC